MRVTKPYGSPHSNMQNFKHNPKQTVPPVNTIVSDLLT